MGKSLVFGDCRLKLDGLLVTPAGKQQVTARQAVLLQALVEAGSVAVPSIRLLDIAWGQGAGTPQNLAKAVFTLRRELAGSQCVHIESVYGYGYRLRVVNSDNLSPGPEELALTLCEEASHRLYERREMSLESAKSLYERAVSIDPSCVPAFLGYAEVSLQLMQSGFHPPLGEWPGFLDAVSKAMAVAPLNADALAYRGLAECVFRWDFPTAQATFAEALEIDPAAPRVNCLAARAALFQGQGSAAIQFCQNALKFNPADMSTRGHLAYALTTAGEIDAARAEIDRMLEIDPSSPVLGSYGGWIEAAYGDPEVACMLAEEKLGHAPNSTVAIAIRAFAFARAGRASAARAILGKLDNDFGEAAPDNALVCVPWVVLGECQAALRVLEAAAKGRDFWLGPMLKERINEPLHGIPDFDALYNSVFPRTTGRSASRRRSGGA